MSEREVDLTELLKFQVSYHTHSENIILLAEKLDKNIDIAGELLKDEVTQKILNKMKKMSLYIKCIGEKSIAEMEIHEAKTKRLIEQFERL